VRDFSVDRHIEIVAAGVSEKNGSSSTPWVVCPGPGSLKS
jgi:hypothetical protein